MRQKQRLTPLFRFLAFLTAAGLTASAFPAIALAQGQKPAAPAPAAGDKVGEAAADAGEGTGDAGPDEATREAARKVFGEARTKFDAGDYSGAYDGFKQANDAIPAPHAEYWMALSLDKLGGKDAETLAAYKLFLANPEASAVGDEQVAQAKERVEALKATVPGKVSILTDPAGATVTIDGTVQEATTPLELDLAPGQHQVLVQLEGHVDQSLALDVEGGAVTEQRIELAPVPAPAAPPPAAAPAPPPPAEKVKRSMVPAYVTLGIAGAGLITGTIFGVQALSKKSDFNDNPTTDGADDVERNALIADMAFGIAITLGVTGIVLLTSDDEAPAATDAAAKSPRRSELVVAPYAGPTGGGAAARLTF